MAEVTGDNDHRRQLLRRGRRLEAATLGWNVVGVCVLAAAATAARSVALAGFGLDSLIEIGASTVVLWELADVNADRQRRAMRLIGFAFVGLALYLSIESTAVLVIGFHPRHSLLGIVWTSLTATVMLLLAFGKAKTGSALGNAVLVAEGRITLIDGVLAIAVFVGLVLNAWAGWWWADPLAGYVLLYYAAREARQALSAYARDPTSREPFIALNREIGREDRGTADFRRTNEQDSSVMAFGQQSGPPASARQVRELLDLLKGAGHADFRDARGPMRFTQRQAAGKFSGDEAAAFITQLLEAEAEAEADRDLVADASTSGRSPQRRSEQVSERAIQERVRSIPSEQLADELRRRGWTATEPSSDARRT